MMYVCRYCGFAVPLVEDIKLHLIGGHETHEENCPIQHINVIEDEE